MAVAIDAVNTTDSAVGTGSTTISNANLTVGSGSNRALWAAMVWVDGGGSAPATRTMRWDTAGTNQAMTEVLFVASGVNNGWISIFGLIAPTAGNKNLTCTWTNINGGYLSCASFTGVDQTSVAVAFTNAASLTGTTSPAHVAVTSAVGNICAYAFQATSAADLVTLDATIIGAVDGFDSNGSGGSNYKAGAASVTSNCTLAATGVWLAAGCNIVAAAVGVFLRPDADSILGSWTNELGGTALFSSIDETVASDTDYIRSSVNPSSDLAKISLSNPSVGFSAPVVLRYRYRKTSPQTANLAVRLLQGATQIAAFTHTGISDSFVTTEQTLTAAQLASITDFTDLYIELTAS